MKTIIIGLGSPLLTDDSVGLKVVHELGQHVAHLQNVELAEDVRGGLHLIDLLAGYDRAVIIDAIVTGEAPPGTIRQLTPSDIPTQRSASQHDVNLPTALELGRQLGMHLPASEHILLVGIEADDILTFSESCTPSVAAANPQAVAIVLEALQKDWR